MTFVQANQTKVPASVVDDSSGGTVAWTNPSQATDQTNGATCTLGAGETSHFLKATQCGFTMPSGAVIEGLKVELEGKASVLALLRESTVALCRGGAIEPTIKDFWLLTWILTFVLKAAGESNDIWDASWTGDDVRDSGFGVFVAVTNVGVLPATAEVRKLQITAHYNHDLSHRVMGRGVV